MTCKTSYILTAYTEKIRKNYIWSLGKKVGDDESVLYTELVVTGNIYHRILTSQLYTGVWCSRKRMREEIKIYSCHNIDGYCRQWAR